MATGTYTCTVFKNNPAKFLAVGRLLGFGAGSMDGRGYGRRRCVPLQNSAWGKDRRHVRVPHVRRGVGRARVWA